MDIDDEGLSMNEISQFLQDLERLNETKEQAGGRFGPNGKVKRSYRSRMQRDGGSSADEVNTLGKGESRGGCGADIVSSLIGSSLSATCFGGTAVSPPDWSNGHPPCRGNEYRVDRPIFWCCCRLNAASRFSSGTSASASPSPQYRKSQQNGSLNQLLGFFGTYPIKISSLLRSSGALGRSISRAKWGHRVCWVGPTPVLTRVIGCTR